MRDPLRTGLPLAALTMAIERQRPGPSQVPRSDQGRQQASANYTKILKTHKIIATISRMANCSDKASMKGFFGSPQVELIHHRRYPTRDSTKRDLFADIEGYGLGQTSWAESQEKPTLMGCRIRQ